MILSMTGFAVKSITLPLGDNGSSVLTVTIKSLNSRFFEVSCKFPYLFSNLETAIIKVLKARLRRGHVYCTMHLANSAALGVQVVPCIKTIASYVDGIALIKNHFSIEQPLLLDHLLRFSNIFEIAEQQIDEKTAALIMKAIDELATQVVGERMREGAELLKDIEGNIQKIETEIATIKVAAQKLVEQQKEKIQKAATLEVSAEDQAVADARKSVMYSVLDKMDIHEELVRFAVHLNNMKNNLAKQFSPDDAASSVHLEKGKQLDFILQELAREINTITAKCADATIGASAINVKVAVEKIREQVQNIV